MIDLQKTPIAHALPDIKQIGQIQIGQSGAQTFRLIDDVGQPYFLKMGPPDGALGIRDEMARLRWLAGRLPVPALLAYAEADGQSFLLTAGLPGENVADLVVHATPERKQWITLLAVSLRHFHTQPWQDCPFDHRFAALFEVARQRTAQEQVDESHFDECRRGQSARTLLAELTQRRPAHEDLCLTHGDYSLPNIIVDGNRLSGFVDLGRVGVGDRYRDLGQVVRSLHRNGCADLIPLFFQEYGLPNPDVEMLNLYQLLDEFF